VSEPAPYRLETSGTTDGQTPDDHSVIKLLAFFITGEVDLLVSAQDLLQRVDRTDPLHPSSDSLQRRSDHWVWHEVCCPC
jgi:hypothetical protein